MKKIIKEAVLTVVLMMTMMFPIRALAQNTAEAEEKSRGSVQIVLLELERKESSREGVEFSIWKIGEVDEAGKPYFDRSYGLGSYPQESADLDAAAKKLADKVSGNPYAVQKTDADGGTCFTDLERGLYLITAAKKNPYGRVSPFLIPVPYLMESGGTLLYEIKAEPKASPYTSGKPERPHKTDNSENNGKSGGSERISTVKTGDETDISFYVLLFFIALAAVGVWWKCRRKEE